MLIMIESLIFHSARPYYYLLSYLISVRHFRTSLYTDFTVKMKTLLQPGE